MFEIFADGASPTAALQAANTKITMWFLNIIIECLFNGVIVARINKDSIITSTQRRVDIRCDLIIKLPRKEKVKARVMLNTAGVILANYEILI